MDQPRVLLADDDIELCDLLREYLTGEGFTVDAVHEGIGAAQRARDDAPDILVLDVMMPLKNGFDVLRELRTTSSLPILMLTARGDDIDRIVGLEIGADDYLVKPCNPRELAARIRAVLRRTGAHVDDSSLEDSGAKTLEINGTRLVPGRRLVEQDDEPVALTSTEFSVLHLLMLEAGNVVSKDALTEQALGRKLSPYDRSIDMHVSNLRKKLSAIDEGEQRIKTIRNAGYLFVS
jgi:DNA-binding response OmpR family regulator